MKKWMLPLYSLSPLLLFLFLVNPMGAKIDDKQDHRIDPSRDFFARINLAFCDEYPGLPQETSNDHIHLDAKDCGNCEDDGEIEDIGEIVIRPPAPPYPGPPVPR